MMKKIRFCLPGIDGIVDLGYVEPEEEKEEQEQAKELELPF